jgi:hypothetical protein
MRINRWIAPLLVTAIATAGLLSGVASALASTQPAVSAGCWHTVGLKSDGSVVATGAHYTNDGQCDVSSWTDVTAVSAGYWHTVGLKSDGSVLATGNNVYGQCDVSGWTDVTAVSAGRDHTVGLKSDGSVLAT